MNLAATMSLSAGAFLGPLAGVRAGMAGVVGGLAALGGVTLSTAGFIRGLRDALDMGGRLADLSARTGVAVADLVTLEQAFKNVGIGADAVGPTINLMQRSLAGISEAGEATQAVFARLGLNMAKLRTQSPIDELKQIAEKIRALPNVAQQSAAAMQIFGRGGAQILPFFKDAQALSDAAQMVGRQGELLARNAGQFDRASDILAAAPVKLRGFFVGAAESISASLLSSLEQVNAFDFTTLGQKFGAAIAPYLEAMKSGKLWQLMGLQITKGLAVGLASVAHLMLVDLPSMFLAGLMTPIEWALSRLKSGFNEVMLSFAEKWNKIAPKKFQVDTARFQGGAEPRSMKDTWNATLNEIHPNSDWGARVGEWFDPAIQEITDGFRTAAQQSLQAAQGIGATGKATPGVKLGPDLGGKNKLFEQNADRLARIGLFIGGAGGPAVDYARRTARATEIMAGILARNGRTDQGLETRQSLWL